MKVYINGFFLSQVETSGVYRFGINIILAMDQLLQLSSCHDEYFLLLPGELSPLLKLKRIKLHILYGFSNKYLWEQLTLAGYVGREFLLSLANFAPLLKTNQLCVIHDALAFCYPQAYRRKFRLLTQFFQRQIVLRSNYLATVSEFSAAEISRHIAKPKQPILILGNSAEHLLELTAEDSLLSQVGLIPGKYILSVFSQKNSAYKNVDNYLRAIAGVDYQFVCLGKVDFGAVSLPQNLISLGVVSDAQLKALYQNAYALLCPSLYEGFGIPVLEAMLCGCPVIAANIPVLREVCAQAAIYLDANDITSIRHQLEVILAHPQLRIEMIAKGSARARQFSWQSFAAKILTQISAISKAK